MSTLPLRALILGAGAAFSLSACATDGYYGGDGYGYYDDGGYGAGSPYYGWYDGFYYPGTGYYVYDRGGRRHSWNDGQRRHWEGRNPSRQNHGENWSGYRRDQRGDRARYQSVRPADRDAPRADTRRNGQEFRQPQRQNRSILRREDRRDNRN